MKTMCYGTRIKRKAEKLELFYDVTKLFGKEEPKDELVYFHANGFHFRSCG